MKKTITLLAILFCTASLFAQNVTFELRWNSDNSNYEFYVKRDITAVAPVTTGGTAAVTIVFPTDGASGTRTVSHTSESVSTFNAAGVIRSPEASPSNDFYVFNSTGGASYIGVLYADVEVLWMTFTPSDGNSEARLFVNDSDPDSTGAGMMGINARSEFNTITTGGLLDEFSVNVLDITNVETENLSIYPNPTADFITISLENTVIDSVELYDITGKLILKSQSNKISLIDFNSGIYLLKIHTYGNTIARRIIKE